MKSYFALSAAIVLGGISLVSSTHASWLSEGIHDIFDRTKTEVPYCKEGQNCSLQSGTDIVANDVQNIEKQKPASQFFQDVAANVVATLSIVGVLFIIYAGFLMLTAGGDDSNIKKGKEIIKGVIYGYIIIFLAWAIVSFVINRILIPSTTTDTNVLPQNQVTPFGAVFDLLAPRTYAEAGIPNQTSFDTYRDQILAFVPKMNNEMEQSGITGDSLKKLRGLVEKSAMTLPDTGSNLINNALVTDVLGKIDQLMRSPGQTALERQMMKSLETYLTNANIPRIAAIVSASPNNGNAPLLSTLSVRDVKDPSGAPVLNENMVWAIRGTGDKYTVIGRGPSISYRFFAQGTNAVFVGILSSSKNKNGFTDVLPFKTKVEVQVKERLANVLLYVNGANVSDVDQVKVTPEEARRGIILDATATTVPAGVTITQTSWDFGNGIRKSYGTSPRIERVPFAPNAAYPIFLRFVTNRNDIIERKINLVVSDPVASIDISKSSGFVGDEFKFKARNNFTAIGLTYVWEVRDSDDGSLLHSSQGPTLGYVFRKSGTFSVRLRTLNPANKEDVDSRSILIESHDPVARFNARQISSETPDTFFLDASASYDPDTAGGELNYDWTIDGEPARLANSARNGAAGSYTFDSLGEHRVALSVTNKDGKIAQYETVVRVDSLLSVKLDVDPLIARREASVSFTATSKAAQVYEWDFGDGTRDTNSTGIASHAYKKSGNYTVNVNVRTDVPKPMSNTIRRSVHVVDSDQPYAFIEAFRDSDPILLESNVCNGQDAFVIDRVKPTRFSAQKSVNVDGTTSGLSYFWTIGTEKNSTQRDVSFKFDELGCQMLSLTAKSDATGKTSTQKVWVKVNNALPELSNINVQILDLNADPIVVKLLAQNAKDPDGAVAAYTWYYYTDNDSEPQGFRVTTVPQASYVLPKLSGKYYFGVVMEDNNGEKSNSEDASSRRYSTPVLSSDSNLMTPIIKLKASSDSVLVGDEVQFTVDVKNAIGQSIAGKNDLEFKWDFEGDGFYDRQTTEGTTKFSYGLPAQYAPKVKVTYKGVSTTQSVRLSVNNVLRPKFTIIPLGDKLVFLNATSGFYNTTHWKVDGNNISDNANYTIYTASGSLPTQAELTVSDGSQEKSEKMAIPTSGRRNKLALRTVQDGLVVISNKLVNDSGNILLSESGIIINDASEKLWIYLGESQGNIDRYTIDSDTSVDSNLNGATDDDADNAGSDSYTSGSPFQINLSAYKRRNVVIRVTLQGVGGTVIAKKDIPVTLAYLPEEAIKDVVFEGISDSDRVRLEKIKGLIQQAPEADRLYLMKSLAQLKEMWTDKVGKTETIIAMQGYLDTSSIPEATRKELYSALDGLVVGDSEVTNDVTLAVGVIKNLLPTTSPAYAKIITGNKAAGEAGILDEILSHPSDIERNKTLGKTILDLIKDDESISTDNKLIIKEQIKVIIYGGAANVPADQVVPPVVESSSEGALHTLGTIGKWVMFLVALLLAGVVVAGFVVKLSNKHKNTGFADGLIDLFGNKPNGGPTPSVTPVKPAPVAPVAQPVVTPVKPAPVAAPVVAPSVPTPTIPSGDVAESSVPDWLKIATQTVPTPEKKEEKKEVAAPVAPAPAAPESSVPDWLQPVAPAPTETSDNVPDWLKPATSAPLPEKQEEKKEPVAPVSLPEKKEEKTPAPAVSDIPAWLMESAPATPASTPAKTSSAPAASDLPAWLQPSAPIASQQEIEEVSEGKSEEGEEASSQYERDGEGKIVRKSVAKKKTSAKKEEDDSAEKTKKSSRKSA